MNHGKLISSEKFRQIREDVFNESMERFGARIGISKNRVNDIENAEGGVAGVSRSTINAIARELGLPPAALIQQICVSLVSPGITAEKDVARARKRRIAAKRGVNKDEGT